MLSFRLKKQTNPNVADTTFKMFTDFIEKHHCWSIFRSCCLQVFFKGVLKNFTKKHQCRSLFLRKLQAYNFKKKQLLHRCFPVNIAKFLRTAVIEHLWWLLLYLFNEVVGLKTRALLKTDSTPTQVFSCEICESFKNAFFTENLWWLLLNKSRRSLWFIVWQSAALVI